ncbi:phage tail assembly protein [Comamonas koreensis]|uniref:Phage tail assembly protein n=1 Tax=Comamonas koreensis TaxID=160825 RepID=A0AAW4XRL9_9BURK|nr:phage tail assembly protein [Comamonas koreensis]MCD2163818.1 phage tail assembly protein [Comamonas koreensis]
MSTDSLTPTTSINYGKTTMTDTATSQTQTLEGEEIINGRAARAITLQQSITRGAQVITKVYVRKPKSGELRGIDLGAMLNANADAIMQVLPRVTEPFLVKHEVENLDPADLLMLGMALVSFFVPKAELQ